MRSFGLAKPPAGKKSVVELFETAWAAYDMPVTTSFSANTSLIPMRECLEMAIDELLKKRPSQESVRGGWLGKIASLFKSLGRAGVTEADIQGLMNQWQNPARPDLALEDELSSAKTANYGRGQSMDVLRRATIFLKQLLTGLDPAKLR
jgi:hypothetical protein